MHRLSMPPLLTWSKIDNYLNLYLQLIDSLNLPGNNSAEALYHSNTVTSYTQMIWQDPNLAGWECRTSYRWFIEHRPSIGLIRFVFIINYKRTGIILDLSYMYFLGRLGGGSFQECHRYLQRILNQL